MSFHLIHTSKAFFTYVLHPLNYFPKGHLVNFLYGFHYIDSVWLFADIIHTLDPYQFYI